MRTSLVENFTNPSTRSCIEVYLLHALICTAFKLLAQAKGVEATNFEGKDCVCWFSQHAQESQLM